MRLGDLAPDAPVRMITAPKFEWAASLPADRFFDTSSSTPRERLKGHIIIYYSPENLDYEPAGEPIRTPNHQGMVYYAAKIVDAAGFSAFDSRDVMPKLVADARWRSKTTGATFTSAERWSRAYVIERAAKIVPPQRAKEILNLPHNWAFRMGVQPRLLEDANRSAILNLEVEEDRLPEPEEVPPVARTVVATALRRAGYTVDSVVVPDAIYAIGDPARPGLLKIGCGTFSDRNLESELGCFGRLDQAKFWTAGQAEFVVKPMQVGAGLGEAAEAFVHDELRRQQRHVFREWFRVTRDEAEKLMTRALTAVTRGA